MALFKSQAFNVDKILKRFRVLGFCHPFIAIRNLCSLGRASLGLSQDVMTTVFGQETSAHLTVVPPERLAAVPSLTQQA
ncbi:hypothetical protein FZC77_18510 [Bacillus swezeyi]|uniref:Uncharacterized protein n=1 Tax=Bacillus swezeyi TaxID=1925020 RepID=A0A5M8RLV0_9BACI|nr:hypothetical protein DX927_21540 [Bacillus swezeyi]TYS34411.1 hypothetical protein FZC77_18510 [Bacillus swezeyi]